MGDDEEDHPTRISSKEQLIYCPVCGKKTDKEEFQVGRNKYNTRVECPEHGALYLGR